MNRSIKKGEAAIVPLLEMQGNFSKRFINLQPSVKSHPNLTRTIVESQIMLNTMQPAPDP